jgi:hypothetical protein
VQGERPGTGLHQTGADGEAGAGAVLETAPHLHGDGHVNGICDRGDDPFRPARVVEQRRAGAGLRHLAHGTAEVDVDDVRAGLHDHPCRLGHQCRFRAEDLNGEWMLVGCDPQVAERPLVAMVKTGAADHLRADEPGAEPTALPAERLHADAGHRGEHHARGHLDRPDPP